MSIITEIKQGGGDLSPEFWRASSINLRCLHRFGHEYY